MLAIGGAGMGNAQRVGDVPGWERTDADGQHRRYTLRGRGDEHPMVGESLSLVYNSTIAHTYNAVRELAHFQRMRD